MAEIPKRPHHRPALPEASQARILGALLILDKGSIEFRRMRRTLANEMDRTERQIDNVFEKLKAQCAKKIAPDG